MFLVQDEDGITIYRHSTRTDAVKTAHNTICHYQRKERRPTVIQPIWAGWFRVGGYRLLSEAGSIISEVRITEGGKENVERNMDRSLRKGLEMIRDGSFSLQRTTIRRRI